MDNIKLIKLVTGEEIIANIIEDNENNFIAEEPYTFGMHQGQIMLIPVSYFLKDKKIRINKNTIIWEAEPMDSIRDEYIKTTSKIIQPSKSIITG